MDANVLVPGTMLRSGSYRIIRFISSGGFGCTYEAEHVMFRERVAIKELFVKDFCQRDYDGSISLITEERRTKVQRIREKFIEEARALRQMSNPGIVRVTDVFEENNTAYYAMDYIDGPSLNDIVKANGPLPEHLALCYIRQIAETLRYVHENHRLHLDIKPGNILIDHNGNAILIDFGSSKLYDETSGENNSTLMGLTPGYAPPEQMAHNISHFLPATDIYSLGATLYKILTGKNPVDSTLRASGEELSPISINISSETRLAITLAMALHKKDRPQTMTDFLSILPAPVEITPGEDSATSNLAITPDAPTLDNSELENTLDENTNAKISQSSESPFYAKTNKTILKSSFDTATTKPPCNNIKNYYQNNILISEQIRPIKETSAVSTNLSRTPTEANPFRRLYKIFFSTISIIILLIVAFLIYQHLFIYDWKSNYSEGLAAVGLNGKCGYIDKYDNEVIPMVYDYAYDFSDGIAKVGLNSKCGFIDKSGNEVVPIIYDNAGDFSDGIALVELNGKFGYIDKLGNEVIPIKYDNLGDFDDGLAWAMLNNKQGYINKSGNVVIPLIYDATWSFEDGKCKVKLNEEHFYIDRNGNRLPDGD